jgi:hypothetical protein
MVDQSDEKPKRQGRPRLTDEEKARRKGLREKRKKLRDQELAKQKKQISKAQKKEKMDTLIVDTKSKLEKGELILSDPILKVIEPLETQTLVPFQENTSSIELARNNPLSLEEITDIWMEQSETLSNKIEMVEALQAAGEKRLRRLDKLCSKLQEEQLLMKELIKIDQDIINKNEQKLPLVDSAAYEYQADRSNLVRRLLEFLSGKPDEMLTNNRIRTHEYKISNRQEQLIKIDRTLADLKIVMLYNGNLYDTLKVTSSDYREIRLQLGREFRESRDTIKRNKLKFDHNKIMESLATNIQKINLVGSQFTELMSGTQQSLMDLNSKFDSLQKRLLFGEDKTKSVNELDDFVSHMFEKFQIENKR